MCREVVVSLGRGGGVDQSVDTVYAWVARSKRVGVSRRSVGICYG